MRFERADIEENVIGSLQEAVEVSQIVSMGLQGPLWQRVVLPYIRATVDAAVEVLLSDKSTSIPEHVRYEAAALRRLERHLESLILAGNQAANLLKGSQDAADE